jgi:hypothetical protein
MANEKKPDAQPVDRTEELLERLIGKFVGMGQQNGLTKADLQEILTTAGAATAQGMEKAVRPENQQTRQISAFFTEEDFKKYGEFANKPKLKRTTYFNYHEEKEDQLTPAEIVAYNSIDDDYEQRNGHLTAIIKQRGRKREELHITLPVKDMDHRFNAPPSLLLLVHELKTGQQVGDMQDVLVEIAELRQRLAKYEGPAPQSRGASSRVLAGGGPLVADLEAGLEATTHEALAR